ncbi:MAG: hypothetical protein ACRD2B_11465, partial [Terriglobia bacterium]
MLTLLPDVPAIYAVWKRLVYEHGVQGVKVYDARLVAIMSVYAVESVLTFNTPDSPVAREESMPVLIGEHQVRHG